MYDQLTRSDIRKMEEEIEHRKLVVRPKALEDVDALRTSSCGTGPFQVSEFNPGVSIKYTKNTGYWQQGKPYLDGVEIYVVEQQTTLSSAFQAGEYDMIMLADMTIASDLMAMGSTASGTIVNETNTNGQGLTICGLIPNSADPSSPFADARVRRAMALAVDAGAICDAFGYGVYTPTDQWATPEAITYNTGITPLAMTPTRPARCWPRRATPMGSIPHSPSPPMSPTTSPRRRPCWTRWASTAS